MREAEHRHLQIMNDVLQGLRNEWISRLAQKEQECEQRVQDAESQALAAISVAKDRGDGLESRLTKTQATYDAKTGELQAEAKTNCTTGTSKRKGKGSPRSLRPPMLRQ